MNEEIKREITLEEAQIKCAELADQYEAMCKLADDLQKKEEEKRYLDLEHQKSARKKEIDEARKAVDEAQEHWSKLMQAYRNDYGYFYSKHSNEDVVSKLFDFFMI